MENIIKDIRTRLRLAMNGVVSTSMREHGVDYKLNFGVSIPKIKEIASLYPENSQLADMLWQQDVRELKIIATLLQPVEGFTEEKATQWAADIKHQEIAEQYCMNLLQEIPSANVLAAEWILKENGFTPVIGFLLYARLFSKGYQLSPEEEQIFLNEAHKVMDNGISRLQRAVVLALKRYGRQNKQQANKVLHSIINYSHSDSLEKQEFFNDIKFEFDFYF